MVLLNMGGGVCVWGVCVWEGGGCVRVLLNKGGGGERVTAADWRGKGGVCGGGGSWMPAAK